MIISVSNDTTIIEVYHDLSDLSQISTTGDEENNERSTIEQNLLDNTKGEDQQITVSDTDEEGYFASDQRPNDIV